jgi:hypothetical protein
MSDCVLSRRQKDYEETERMGVRKTNLVRHSLHTYGVDLDEVSIRVLCVYVCVCMLLFYAWALAS